MGFHPEYSRKDKPADFQPYQIVCLEYETRRLYAEVVQIAEERQVCWVRPLLLVIALTEQADWDDTELLAQAQQYDLRNGSDLLCPTVLFRAALDTELLPLLNFLYASDRTNEKPNREAHQQLNQLITTLWKAYPEAFRG